VSLLPSYRLLLDRKRGKFKPAADSDRRLADPLDLISAGIEDRNGY
jgi:hypothetical protein